jgi:hypothetical protein
MKVMEEIFSRFEELYEQRFKNTPTLSMGEDSVRYDFFLALQEVLNLAPHELQIEHPICPDAFIPRNHPKSTRKEKPQLDLWVDVPQLKAGFEFGLFRQNSNINGNINQTNRTYKLITDFLRLALHQYFDGGKAHFICVADAKMLKHQLKTKLLSAFPADEYKIDKLHLDNLLESSKNDVDRRFVNKFRELETEITAKKVYDEEIFSKINTLETRILIWEINSIIK